MNILITGVTAGIGKACALLFAEKGHHIIGFARRKNKLDALKTEIETRFSVKFAGFPVNVQNRKAISEAIYATRIGFGQIDVLINNAGLSLGNNLLQDGDPNDWDTMIDTNIKGLLNVSQPILKQMVAHKAGHIINIASIVSKEVYKSGVIYSATKHAVEALTKAMRIDCLPYGIRVGQICPGLVQTEFSLVRAKGNVSSAKKKYQGYKPLEAIDIAEIALYMATAPAHVNVNDVVVTPLAQANTSYIIKK